MKTAEFEVYWLLLFFAK